MLIFQCILSLNIDFTNDFYRADILSGEPLFIGILGDFKSDEGKFDAVIIFKKILYDKSKSALLRYENLLNGFSYPKFLVSNVYPFLFISKTNIFVVYVDYCLFGEFSK